MKTSIFKYVINIFLLLLQIEIRMIMQITGVLFAAGLGTRLYPLTASKPKALVSYQGQTLLNRALEKLWGSGIQDIVVNVHHFPDMMLDALRSHPLASHIRVSDERAYLRDTAGGLKFAEPFWQNSDLILIYNVDILSDIDLNKMIENHICQKAEATLAVRHRNTQRYFLFDQHDRQLCGWQNVKTGEKIMARDQESLEPLAFSGIHILNTEFAHTIPTVEKSSITGFYISQASHHRILGYLHDEDKWQDVGKYEEFRNLLS